MIQIYEVIVELFLNYNIALTIGTWVYYSLRNFPCPHHKTTHSKLHHTVLRCHVLRSIHSPHLQGEHLVLASL